MRKYEYSGNDFSVRIEPAFREDVGVIYTRHGNSLKLVGELIGKNWEGITLRFLQTSRTHRWPESLATSKQHL